ncbi:MAG TPA: sigma-70 family RNA polymerase sigma factor [Thermoleophilaceae bacterium]
MEASVLSQPAKITAIGARAPFLRLQSDEKLIDLIRAGHEAAFEALVQRYRSRLLAFCRHMLRSREDAEDVLQEVFAASYRAIVADEREILVRPWLYRIARNMCLKHLGKRRPATDGGVEEMDIAAASSTVEAVHMREDLRQIVGDVRELPETQRTALLMREIDGLSYEQIAGAMERSVPGVKSLLVRARVSLAEAAQGRLLSCEVVHVELRHASEGFARLSGPARRHARHCELCGTYQAELGVSRRAAAAAFLPLAPAALVKALLSRFGAGAAAGSGAASAGATGGAAGATSGAAGGAISATLGAVGAKAAVAVATATLVAAGAADLHRSSTHHRPHAAPAAQAQAAPVALPASTAQSTAAVDRHLARAATTTTKHHRHHSTAKHTSGGRSTEAAGSTALPATTGGEKGTFADSPPPPSAADTPSGHATQPTDPASQPIGAHEPVQVQGFTPSGPADSDSPTSP